MKTITWLKYDFTAELRPRVAAPGDDATTEQYPPTGNYVKFAFRGTGGATIRILSPTGFPMNSALVGITDRFGNPSFPNESNTSGDYWYVYHVEPVYDFRGVLIYWLHIARRLS